MKKLIIATAIIMLAALLSGRISDIAIHPKNKKVWYVAAGSGGVWRTENAGAPWTPGRGLPRWKKQ